MDIASADRLTTSDRFFIYGPVVLGVYKLVSGEILWGVFFFTAAFVNRLILLNNKKKKIISESTLKSVSALKTTIGSVSAVIGDPLIAEESNKSKEDQLMGLHKLGLTLNSDEIEFLKSRGKVL